MSKATIPASVRREVALSNGGVPGQVVAAACRYCGAEGEIHWFSLADGSPSAWVAFAHLELDHVVAESAGGPTDAENIVLACRSCNRRKGVRHADSFYQA